MSLPKTLAMVIMGCALLCMGAVADPSNVIQTGVQLTLDAAGFSAVHLLPDTEEFEVYNTLGQSVSGRLHNDAQFQVNLNAPGVEYWPYINIEISLPADGDASTVIENYFNPGSSNFTLEIYGPNGVVHNAPVADNNLTGFHPLGTFADLGIVVPGDYYLKLTWKQTTSGAPVPYTAWEATLLDEFKSLKGSPESQLDALQAWLGTHPPMP